MSVYLPWAWSNPAKLSFAQNSQFPTLRLQCAILCKISRLHFSYLYPSYSTRIFSLKNALDKKSLKNQADVQFLELIW
jgi:hypothetical protein